MGKGPIYGEFTFPKNDVTYVRGYARGGKVSQAKVSKVMHEFGAGKLHSGSKKGPVVQNRKQAVAIGMSEGRKAAAGKYASGGMVETSKIPMPRDSLTKVDIRPKPPIDRSKIINKARGGPVPGGGVGGSGKLLGELMGIPKKNEIGKDSRKYAAGGMVGKPAGPSKPAAVMKPRAGKKPPSGKSHKNPVPKDAGAPKAAKAPAAMGSMGAMGMKAGGLAKRASMKMSPKAKSDAPPKSINVKSRMGIGLGSMDKYAAGGMVVHSDAAQDKAMIKRAVGMHDTQLHGGKHTNLSKLKSGGMAKVKNYAHGGAVRGAQGGLHGAGMGGGLGQYGAQAAGKKVVHKRYGGSCKG